MSIVLRWGRSAYETDEVLALERQAAEALGLKWRLVEQRQRPTSFEGADVLVIPSRVRLDASAVEAFGGRLVVATTSGYDHIDLDACRERGVAVVRLPQARADAVVEQALAQLIALLRRLPVLHERARANAWARGELPHLAPRLLGDATVAVIGLGVIGRKMASLLRAHGARVLGVDPLGVPEGVEARPLEQALREADAVTLHCSLTASSANLLSAERLALLAPHAVVVNTARGDVLDVEAAIEAVRAGRLAGLATDVFPVEPYPGLARAALVPNVLLTPHSAGYSHDLGQRVAAGVLDALRAWVERRPLPFRLV